MAEDSRRCYSEMWMQLQMGALNGHQFMIDLCASLVAEFPTDLQRVDALRAACEADDVLLEAIAFAADASCSMPAPSSREPHFRNSALQLFIDVSTAGQKRGASPSPPDVEVPAETAGVPEISSQEFLDALAADLASQIAKSDIGEGADSSDDGESGGIVVVPTRLQLGGGEPSAVVDPGQFQLGDGEPRGIVVDPGQFQLGDGEPRGIVVDPG
jgi:hypothetical protein